MLKEMRQCPKCYSKGRDKNKDNLAVYVDEDGYESFHCFACNYTRPSKKWLKENSKYKYYYLLDKDLDMGISFTLEEIKKEYEFSRSKYREISPSTYKYYGVMHKRDEDGELCEQIYPTFNGGDKPCGFKRRKLPKEFVVPYGETGASVELFGQWRFRDSNSRTLCITAGEIDCLSVFQALKNHTDNTNKTKGTDFGETPVVSSTIGEQGTAAQVRNNWDFINKFDKIVYFPDNDEAGKEAIEKLAEALPLGKLFIAKVSKGDVNECLQAGLEKDIVNAYFRAKQYVIDGVKSADEGWREIAGEIDRSVITLPPFMRKISDMMPGGGIIQGRIMNIIGHTSIGKSSIVNRIVHHSIFNSPTTPTIVTLEAVAGLLTLDLISIELKRNMRWDMTDDEIKKWLNSKEGEALYKRFCFKDDGITPRYFMIDDRTGSIKHLEEQIEIMYSRWGSRFFIVDVLSDLLRGVDAELAESHMSFQRTMCKNGCTFLNVLHSRKPDKDGQNVGEYDALGSGSFVQSASYNILINRDKTAEDEITRNTTKAILSKCRGGRTGDAGEWYYDFPTFTMYDLEDYFKEHPELINYQDTQEG